jgi:lipopolysaccharide transport system ATP-binding protein
MVTIKVENLSKVYRLGEIGTGTISRDIERWFKMKVLKGEDPFLKIGENNNRSVKGISDIIYSLRDINFEIQQGDAVGIIGRNGAGKSTLLKILSRVTTPSNGKIKIKGRVASLLEVGTGFHPELTGRENIYLNGAILGMRKREIDRKLDEIVDFSGVERYIDTPVKRYSSGMYVRLAFAVAAHLDSEILIVDEVLAVGDADFQKKCLGKMEDVSKGEGRTVLFVSHNMGSISQLCRTGIYLNNGLLEIQDKVQLVTRKYITGGNLPGDEYENNGVDLINYVKKIFLTDINHRIANNFQFCDEVVINFQIVVKQVVPNLLFGVVLLDKNLNKVFTIVKKISELKLNNLNEIKTFVTLPSNIIAPGKYSLNFLLWVKDVHTYHFVENKINFTIYDSGTEMAEFDGFDYGNVIIHPTWDL